MFNKIKNRLWILRSIFHTIYFNFHYLPFRQAIKLPILLYKPKLLKCKGNIEIKGKIKIGMIQLGKYNVPLYPNNGIMWENHGGTIIFNGRCSIGNNSAISIGTKGYLVIGDKFNATSSLKLVCWHSITFDANVLCGWECLIMDTDFHQLTCLDSPQRPKAFDKIVIGKNNWFALKCTIMKGTKLSDNNVIAARSLLNKDYSNITYSLLAGQPAIVKKKNIYRNNDDDRIYY